MKIFNVRVCSDRLMEPLLCGLIGFLVGLLLIMDGTAQEGLSAHGHIVSKLHRPACLNPGLVVDGVLTPVSWSNATWTITLENGKRISLDRETWQSVEVGEQYEEGRDE